jgi:hypothetical protein
MSGVLKCAIVRLKRVCAAKTEFLSIYFDQLRFYN